MEGSIQEKLARLRAERAAREKARLERLREINLKKYNKTESFPTNSRAQTTNELKKTNSTSRIKDNSAPVKNNFHVNGTTKRPISSPTSKTVNKSLHIKEVQSKTEGTINKNVPKIDKVNKISSTSTANNIDATKTEKVAPKTGNIQTVKPKLPSQPSLQSKTLKLPEQTVKLPGQIVKLPGQTVKLPGQTVKLPVQTEKLPAQTEKLPVQNSKPGSSQSVNSRILKEIKPKSDNKTDLSKFALKNSMRKSMVPVSAPSEKPILARKSVASMDNKQSVFERLYKPKYEPKQTVNEVERIKKDPVYLKQVMKSAQLILPGNVSKQAVRRSISAVHFKRINKNELSNCIHKCSSVGDKLNKIHLENDILVEEEVTSAIKSERKKVKFMTPMSFNTPRPEELQYRLKNWLQKRGKSLDSYHHLQCFGLNHLSIKPDDSLQRNVEFDDENKENIALDSDSDDGSYNENMNQENRDKIIVEDSDDFNKWRRVSNVSESVVFDDSHRLDETLTSPETNDDLVTGALIDLAELTREGFDWKQSARWLRAIRERYPEVTNSGAYWECRAVLEESRGEPFASLKCWEEAVAKGTEQKVAEANLDHLLEKFLQLEINPTCGQEKRRDPKQLVDINNIFRSSLIRFTIKQGKQRQSQTPMACVTPVRRSGRLSVCPSSNQRVCENMRQVAKMAPVHIFTPNKNLVATP